MAELDLIPLDYRNKLKQRSVLRHCAISFVILNVVVLIGAAIVGDLTQQAVAHEQELQSQSAAREQQQSQLAQMELQQTEYEHRWSLLRGLRAGAAIEDVFNIIDVAVIGDELWFSNWQFRRAGVVVDGDTRTIETGYFLIVPASEQPGDATEWMVETHMTLQGQALDHQALSTFLRALFQQPDIKDINVRRTSLTDYANGRVVSFELTIVLNSEIQDT